MSGTLLVGTLRSDAVHSRAADAKHLGSSALVATEFLNHSQDVPPLGFLERDQHLFRLMLLPEKRYRKSRNC